MQLIERAGRAAEDEKVKEKMAESWEELSLVTSSPTLITNGIEGVVLKHVAKAAKQQKGISCSMKHFLTAARRSSTAVPDLCPVTDDLCQQSPVSSLEVSGPESKSRRIQLSVVTLQVPSRPVGSSL